MGYEPKNNISANSSYIKSSPKHICQMLGFASRPIYHVSDNLLVITWDEDTWNAKFLASIVLVVSQVAPYQRLACLWIFGHLPGVFSQITHGNSEQVSCFTENSQKYTAKCFHIGSILDN